MPGVKSDQSLEEPTRIVTALIHFQEAEHKWTAPMRLKYTVPATAEVMSMPNPTDQSKETRHRSKDGISIVKQMPLVYEHAWRVQERRMSPSGG